MLIERSASYVADNYHCIVQAKLIAKYEIKIIEKKTMIQYSILVTHASNCI